MSGIQLRLGYLQSLGVDALVLQDGDAHSSPPLEPLIREASRFHLRVLLTVTPEMQRGSRETLLAAVHGWLSAGAAGLWVPGPVPGSPSGDPAYADLIRSLASMLRALPGEHVLLTEPVPQSMEPTSRQLRAHRRVDSAGFGATGEGRLALQAELPVQAPLVGSLRQALQAIADEDAVSPAPLLGFAGDPPTASPGAAIAAAVLLGSRGAAIFDFGDEIGLDTAAHPARTGASSPPVMQWTPLNVQQAPVERRSLKPAATPPGEITPFGSYRPYVRPPRRAKGTVSASSNSSIPAAPPPPDPNTLPGFTRGHLPDPPVEGAKINVATEESDPDSLLNAYRHLIALHHGNATLRDGSQAVLDRDAQDALVWVRRAPAGARTVANVVIAANLGARPVTLSLDADLQHLGVRPGLLRPLFTWSPGQPLTGESTGALMLPPHAVYLGEIFHAR